MDLLPDEDARADWRVPQPWRDRGRSRFCRVQAASELVPRENIVRELTAFSTGFEQARLALSCVRREGVRTSSLWCGT
jgi:hypothetical protein